MMRHITSSLVVALVVAASAAAAGAQDSLSSARDQYAAAAYEDALASLDRLRQAQRPTEDARAVEQYRAFCLLALGRTAEAEQAIAAVVETDPLYRPTDSDLSPRLRNAFVSVRQRVLPTVVEERYAEAKSAYDKKEFAAAASGFGQVLEILKDSDLAAAAHEAPLSDIVTLASGFRELSVKAAAPPPPPLPVVAAAPATPPAAPKPPVPNPDHIYALGDTDVVPPVVLHQTLPPYRGRPISAATGLIEVVIDENGAVVSAAMRASVGPEYDGIALQAARGWRYRPATVNGVPVKFRRLVQIALKATT